jgi:hypothetical protein
MIIVNKHIAPKSPKQNGNSYVLTNSRFVNLVNAIQRLLVLKMHRRVTSVFKFIYTNQAQLNSNIEKLLQRLINEFSYWARSIMYIYTDINKYYKTSNYNIYSLVKITPNYFTKAGRSNISISHCIRNTYFSITSFY